ncbi:MAG: diaminobutyrate acetyltransferase [Phenylobacterium sp.]|nr:diaminobutyrate acetyltransferase [Phenylobacterium sp.]
MAPGIRLRAPTPADGPAVTGLIRRCPPLDVNSAYCNLVQCAHFADTCVVAESGGRVVGWISAHRPPTAPEQIFVWQVAVDETARGVRLGGRMLEALLARPAVRGATVLTTTVTEPNAASWGLFEGFARRHGLTLTKAPLFTRELHFAGEHDTEWQASIGPLPLNQEQSAKETP